MPTIHVHGANGSEYVYASRTRVRLPTRDAGSLRSMYDDLARRMALCALETKKRGRTGDDLAAGNEHGHQFYGNQHTGGINGLPKHAHIEKVQMALVSQELKSLKMAVHKLLSSGHPFTKQELAEAVGLDPKGKTINDYLTNLKNPKFAGPQGALKIEKNKEGHYFVAMPDGSPAPPPDTKLDLSKGHSPTVAAAVQKLPDDGHGMPAWPMSVDPDEHDSELQAEANAMTAAYVPPPAHVPAPHAPEPSYDPVQHDAGVSAIVQLKAAAPGSMGKLQADDLYSEAKLDAASQFKTDVVHDDMDPETAALKFKNTISFAMAAWATAVHGTPFKATKHEKAFKADMQMVKDLQSGMGSASALIKWKNNTAAEKAGTWPPKEGGAAEPVQKASPFPTPKPVSATTTQKPIIDMGHPSYVPPIDYHTLRPKSFEDMNASDMLQGKFRKGILKLKKDLQTDSSSSSGNKMTVEQKLRARLANAPNFQALNKRLGLPQSGQGSLESKLIGAWASSSGDSNDISVSLQMATRDAFDIPDAHIEKKALKALVKHGHDVDSVVASGVKQLSGSGITLQPHEIGTARAALVEFIQAQYHETQEHLKALGHDHVYLARGMTTIVAHDNADGTAAVKLQPASSFSTNYSTAKSFASYDGTVFLVKVPRQQVLGSYRTGFGCTGEHEVVVLAHEKLQAYTVHGTLANSATEAQQLVQKQLIHANSSLKVTEKPDDLVETYD